MTVMNDVVKEDEPSSSKKYLRWYAQSIASDSPVQLLAFPWRSCLELTVEEVKHEWLTPFNNQCSGQAEVVIHGWQLA